MEKIFDCSDQQQIASWQPVNDGVMGGCSRSGMQPGPDGTAIFFGEVSFENNGGFASVRCNRLVQPLDRATGLRLRLRGDGKRYKFNLRTDTRLDSINWQVRLDTVANAWQELDFHWSDFRPTRHGHELPETPPLDPAAVVGLGLLIADRQQGPFRLELAWINPLD